MNFELIDRVDSLYYTFRIPKGNGKYRVITAPTEELKSAQRSVIKELQHIQTSRDAMGFVHGRSIVNNAQKHKGQPYVFNMDLKDFFPSVTKEMIVQALIRHGVEEDLADKMARLCTLRGVLPQGAPSSPFLSNVVAKPMDRKISKLCKGIQYTRYADDITLSGDKDAILAIKNQIMDIIKSYGFRINYDKVKGYTAGNRQEVTGVIVNKKPNINRKYYDSFRVHLHHIKCMIKDGEIKSPQDLVDKSGDSVDKLRGYASFIRSLNQKKGERFMKQIKEIEGSISRVRKI